MTNVLAMTSGVKRLEIATTGCSDPRKNSFERVSKKLLTTRLRKNSHFAQPRNACHLNTYVSYLSARTDSIQSQHTTFPTKTETFSVE